VENIQTDRKSTEFRLVRHGNVFVSFSGRVTRERSRSPNRYASSNNGYCEMSFAKRGVPRHDGESLEFRLRVQGCRVRQSLNPETNAP